MKTATKITTETMTITPAIAKQLLDRNKKNRPLSKVNLRYLENELMKGVLYQYRGEYQTGCKWEFIGWSAPVNVLYQYQNTT